MYIPLRKDFRVRYPLRESVRVDEEFLSERLHSFEWQKRVAFEVARKFLPFLPTLKENDGQNYIFDVETTNPEIKQVVLFAYRTFAFTSSGALVRMDTDAKTATIELRIVGSDCSLESLASILGHELSHIGTIMSKYENDVRNINPPEQYEAITQAIHDTIDYKTALEKEIYEYAFALYCTSDIEITAFISQTEFELRKLADKDALSIEDIKKYIRFTESYQAFSLAKTVAQRVLSKTKYEKEWFAENLEKYGLNAENIDSQMKHLKYRADYALEKCAANAMLTLGD